MNDIQDKFKELMKKKFKHQFITMHLLHNNPYWDRIPPYTECNVTRCILNKASSHHWFIYSLHDIIQDHVLEERYRL